MTFYYSRKITRNEQKLCDLRAEKKKILEDVMDKETYKVARTILEKFAPEQLRSKGFVSTLHISYHVKLLIFLPCGKLIFQTQV